MTIRLVINQVGLAPGRDNESRSDGLSTGADVSFEHIGTGTATFELLWVPTDDTTAVASFSQGSNKCTFTPDVDSMGGTYRVKVTLVTGPVIETMTRLFSIRTAELDLRIPALNEQSDPDATLLNNGQAVIEVSENNEPAASGPFSRGNYGGWYSALTELMRIVETRYNE